MTALNAAFYFEAVCWYKLTFRRAGFLNACVAVHAVYLPRRGFMYVFVKVVRFCYRVTLMDVIFFMSLEVWCSNYSFAFH